jgi:predicted regulator of Ras-like GTPase activity (Roadblock/LC7/MglB family)
MAGARHVTSPFAALLFTLVRHRGVKGCMVVDERDGVIVDANLQLGVDGAAMAALAASVYRKARRAAAAAGFGEIAFFELDAEHGRVCAAGRGGLVVVLVAENRVNVGLVRVEMLRALEAFA